MNKDNIGKNIFRGLLALAAFALPLVNDMLKEKDQEKEIELLVEQKVQERLSSNEEEA